MIQLEVCVDSVESAIAAQEGGADRLELCANLSIGGTTPTPALYERVRARTKLPVHVLMRPRFGDFLYSDEEYAILKAEVRQFSALGADALVIGMLTPDGALDGERLGELIAIACGRRMTLHRAFDVSRDPFESLQAAVQLGFSSILTSGQQRDCVQGAPLLAQLVRAAGKEIEVLVGAGVTAGSIARIAPKIGAKAYHMSGKCIIQSDMRFRREGIPMGLPGLSEYEVWRTQPDAVRAVKQILNNLEKSPDA